VDAAADGADEGAFKMDAEDFRGVFVGLIWRAM